MRRNIQKESQRIDGVIGQMEPSLAGRMYRRANTNYQKGQAMALRRPRNRKLKQSEYDKGIDAGKNNYAKMLRDYRYLLFGSAKYKVKGLILLAIMALTGDKRLTRHLKLAGDKITLCEPVCDNAGQGGRIPQYTEKPAGLTRGKDNQIRIRPGHNQGLQRNAKPGDELLYTRQNSVLCQG